LQPWFDQIQGVGWEDMGLKFPPHYIALFVDVEDAQVDVVICWREVARDNDALLYEPLWWSSQSCNLV